MHATPDRGRPQNVGAWDANLPNMRDVLATRTGTGLRDLMTCCMSWLSDGKSFLMEE